MHETIAWLYGLQHFGIKLGLDNIRSVLELLGHPEREFPSLHVAGTNGKGSVAAMVDAMLGASGQRSGLFTSPHLVRPNERIRIAGSDIASKELHGLLRELRGLLETALQQERIEAHPSFFEVITAAALLAFRRRSVDAAVLEVGLGGRLDATNAVDAAVGAIVSVGLDHVKTLGPTIEKIAGEKAGIIKPGMPVVCGVTQQGAIDTVRRVCSERGARFIDVRSACAWVGEDASGIVLETAKRRYPALRIGLPGRHQIENARIALVAFELLAERIGFRPDPRQVAEGLGSVRWPGRLQWVDPEDGAARLLLDAAHNEAGVEALAGHLDRLGPPTPVLLFGVASGKPVERMLEPLQGRVSQVVLTRPPVDRGVEPDEFVAFARSRFPSVEVEEEVGAALELARLAAGNDRFVLVAGSLYLVGDVLRRLEREESPGPVAM